MATDRQGPISNDSPPGAAFRPAETTFEAVPATVPKARHLLDGWLADCGLEGDGADLKLAVSELVANAVRHGEAPIRLIMAKLADRVRIEVHDCGGGHPAIRAIQATGPKAGGWGLRLVDQVVDRWGTQTDGDHTTVWVEQALPTTHPARGTAE